VDASLVHSDFRVLGIVIRRSNGDRRSVLRSIGRTMFDMSNAAVVRFGLQVASMVVFQNVTLETDPRDVAETLRRKIYRSAYSNIIARDYHSPVSNFTNICFNFARSCNNGAHS